MLSGAMLHPLDESVRVSQSTAETSRQTMAQTHDIELAAAKRTHGVYSHSLHAQPTDTDELGHVSNLVYLHWVQDMAKRASAARGLDLEAYRTLGAVFVVRRHEIEYYRQVLPGDELELHTWISSWGAATSLRETRIFQAETRELVCTATTRWAFIDLHSGRPKRIPESVRKAFVDG